MNLCDRLRLERERLELSQTAFAALVGASKHAQINWEKGSASPNAAALAIWSSYGVDVLYVLTGQRNSPAPLALTPREAALLDNYQHTDAEGQKIIEGTAHMAAQSKARRA